MAELDLVKNLYDYIADDPRITINLALWDFGSGYEPAIFTVEPPNECGFPLITIGQEQGNSEMLNRRAIITSVPFTVRVWGNKTGSNKGLLAVSNLLYSRLNECVLTLADGYEFKRASVSPPSSTEDELGFPGYEIVCTIDYIELI